MIEGFEGWTVNDFRMLKHVCEQSFEEFCSVFYKHVVEDAFILQPFHQSIIGAMEKVRALEITRLVINVPPGYTKTLLCSVMFPAWAATMNHCRFLMTSYSHGLVEDNSILTKRIMVSPLYQLLWPTPKKKSEKDNKKGNKKKQRIKGVTEKETMTQWSLSKQINYYGASSRGQITGKGRAGFLKKGFSGAIVIDDPLKVDEAFSKVVRDRVNTNFHRTIYKRIITPRTPIVIIMQRLHAHDLSGFVLNGGTGESWHHLELPILID